VIGAERESAAESQLTGAMGEDAILILECALQPKFHISA
jgi:hypothetical protein